MGLLGMSFSGVYGDLEPKLRRPAARRVHEDYSTKVATGGFNAGKPRVLYVGPLGGVAPDGQRFLTIAGVAPSQPFKAVRMILNWGHELHGGSRK